MNQSYRDNTTTSKTNKRVVDFIKQNKDRLNESSHVSTSRKSSIDVKTNRDN
jgi:hypothetical protein